MQESGNKLLLVILLLLLFVASLCGLLYLAGRAWGGLAVVNWLSLVALLVVIAVAVAYKKLKRKGDYKKASFSLEEIRKSHRQHRDALIKEYEAQAKPIKDAYKEAKDKSTAKPRLQMQLKALAPHYIAKEKVINDACMRDETELCEHIKEEVASQKRFPKKAWTAIVLFPIVFCLALVCYGWGAMEYMPNRPGSADGNGWTAATVPMPHLNDGNQYVSNPDKILSDEDVSRINGLMKTLDVKHGIETAIVVVGHIDGGEATVLAQGLFDRYGIGRNNMGLVFAMGYDDHSARLHTGRALEADLTDIEASRLLNTYLLPYLKAEKPSEGVVVLCEAICKFFDGKRLPPQPEISTTTAADVFGFIYLFLLLIAMFWLFGLIETFSLYEDDKINGLHPVGLMNGPWHNDTVEPRKVKIYSYGSSGGSSYSSYDSGYSSSSSGSSSGGYGGGSSGGGGASLRW